MKAFGFFNYGGGEDLFKFIVSCRNKNYIPYEETMKEIARTKFMTPEAFTLLLEEFVRTAFRKNFEDEKGKTLVIEFTKLVNKLAGGLI